MAHNPIAAIIGGGVIGGGWAARFLLAGWDVNIFDPDPDAERKIGEVLDNARRALPALYDHRLPDEGKLQFCPQLEDAVKQAQWVAESVPERRELKQKVLANIETHAPPEAIIASSTSGFKPSELQDGLKTPERVIVAHPFNPVYLIPLVELVGNTETIVKAQKTLKTLGCYPLHVRQEIDAHIADRLLEAVWREGLWLVNDGIATTEEIDACFTYGFGLRWAQMGLFETYRVAGGEAGMAHFMAQFGPALKWPWTKLMDVPELSQELIDTIAAQSDAQSGHMSIRELERQRDDNLVTILRGLKTRNWGAGALLSQFDTELRAKDKTQSDIGYIRSVNRVIPINWTDYNGHMNEGRYGQVFSDAADAVMAEIGADADYIAQGLSFFTVETKVNFLVDCKAGDKVFVDSQIMLAEGKKLKLAHLMMDAQSTPLARCEQFLLHVDLGSRKSAPPRADIAETMRRLADKHADLPPLWEP